MLAVRESKAKGRMVREERQTMYSQGAGCIAWGSASFRIQSGMMRMLGWQGG